MAWLKVTIPHDKEAVTSVFEVGTRTPLEEKAGSVDE